MKLGFGCYRIAAGNFAHEQALRYALDNGVNTIDTSTNYSDGLSEILVGEVAADYDRSSLTIISKFGYIQGTLLTHFSKRETTDDVIKFSETMYHCIHPDFVHTQLDTTLNRLNMEYVDTYLIHNPEYFLMHTIDTKEDVKQARASMNRRLYDAFIALEREVKKGRIKSYGISSNAFALDKEDLHFLPYETLLDLAQLAADEVGHINHHFSTIELPLNMLETKGLKCVAWAKKNSLKVVVNRPLNASYDNLMYRLANYTYPDTYDSLLNETLDLAKSAELETLENFIAQLDEISHKFGFIGEYEDFLYAQVVPTLQKALALLGDEDFETVVEMVNNFLDAYKEKVAFEIAKRTPASLKAHGIVIGEPMQKDALAFLLKNDGIDLVLVGMRKVKYVQDALTIANAL